MQNKYRRAIAHLEKTSSQDDVIEAIEAVEDLFSVNWLKQNQGHRLQILWARRDSISTSELFALGKAILKLSVNSRLWLEANAREIKKNINNSHGLLTEIITIGSLSTNGGIVTPCTKSYPLYDYTIDFDTGYRYKVSVKNFDISIHEKRFNTQCELIRKTFKNFLKRKETSGRLIIMFERESLTSKLAEQICCLISFRFNSYGDYHSEDGRAFIRFSPLDEYNGKGLVDPSDTVLIICKQHHNEQRNIKDKIKQAHDKLLADPDDEKSLKKLLIRLGTTSDIDMMNKYMQELADNREHCGFDMYELIQPAVVSDLEDDTTMIVTSVYSGMKSTYLEPTNIQQKLKNIRPLSMEVGVGGVSHKKSPLVIMSDKSTMKIDLSSFYIYQKGDIYLQAEMNGDSYVGNLSKLAPGILLHSVVNHMTISPVVFAQDDKLLIV